MKTVPARPFKTLTSLTFEAGDSMSRLEQVRAAGLKCILRAAFECKKHTGSQFTDLRPGLELRDRLLVFFFIFIWLERPAETPLQ